MLLRRRAQEIVDLAEKTAKELKHGEEMVSGEISIGCGETQNMKPLSEMIASFRQKYPDVSFNIYTAIADDVKERLCFSLEKQPDAFFGNAEICIRMGQNGQQRIFQKIRLSMPKYYQKIGILIIMLYQRKIYMAWLPFEDKIAGASENLVLKYK